MTAPHLPAAFINAIAEEGTKAEAIEYLQKTWNENCALRAQLVKFEQWAKRNPHAVGGDAEGDNLIELARSIRVTNPSRQSH
jgi:hypothetical protein